MRLSDAYLRALLDDDVPYGDATTLGLGIGAAAGKMRFSARGAQTLCCVEEAARLIELAGGTVRTDRRSGEKLENGALILEAEGTAEILLATWKVAQTLVEATSGIATAVAAIVEAASDAGEAVVACTRKNFPGTKALALRAVTAGGGVPHRLGLSDSLLVFPEHRAFLADPAAALALLKRRYPEKKVVVEVTSVAEALALAAMGADVLQLEKFAPEAVAQLVERLARRSIPDFPIIAAAGGVNAANATAYVRAGARVLVTSAPYWARPTDVSVLIEAA